jgi:hypothetical protein
MRAVLVDVLYELTGVIADDDDGEPSRRSWESLVLDRFESLLDICLLAGSLLDGPVAVDDFFNHGCWSALVVPARTSLERAYWPPRRVWRRTGRNGRSAGEYAPALVFPFDDLVGEHTGVLVRRRIPGRSGDSVAPVRPDTAPVVPGEVWTGLRELRPDDWLCVGRIRPTLVEPWVYETRRTDPEWIRQEFAIPDPEDAAARFLGAVARSLRANERLRFLLLKWFD